MTDQGDTPKRDDLPTPRTNTASSPANPADGGGVAPKGDLTRTASEPLPQRIGKYRILRLLGEGGFGVVYLGVSDDGLRRMVAIKVLRAGVAHSNSIRRFLREREILPALHHPNIAGFLDADETEDGRPFYVMEFVEGKRLTDHCDENNLTVEERLDLFERVCDAVQHAHSRLVLHRDLKPSNIIVDRNGQPKLLDFGIARLLARDLEASADLVTVGDDVALTPEYASPEQLRGDALDVTSDVYSLGVILYELLTARRPYQLTSRLRVAASRVVEEATVIAPSACVGLPDVPAPGPGGQGSAPRTGDPTTTASRRGTSVDRLRRNLSGDLDKICLMALRKETRKRYASAQALLDDLRRHRSGLPVTARGDGRLYRIGKWARRHRLLLAAMTSVALLGAWAGMAELSSLREREARAKERAALAQSFMNEFARSASAFGGSLQARTAGLAILSKTLQAMNEHAGDDEGLSLQVAETGNQMLDAVLAMLSGSLATNRDLGERGLAEIAGPTVDRWSRLAEAVPGSADRQTGLAVALARQALLEMRVARATSAGVPGDGAMERSSQDRAAAAVEAARRAASLARNGPAAGGRAATRALATALWAQATTAERSDPATMRTLLEEAAELALPVAEAADAEAPDFEVACGILGSLGNLDEQRARTQPDQAVLDAARERYERSLRIARRWVAGGTAASGNTAARALMDALQRAARAWNLSGARDAVRSERLLDEMLAVAASLRPVDPDIIQRLSDLARTRELRGHVVESEQDSRRASDEFLEALKLVELARAIQPSDELAAWVVHLNVLAGRALLAAGDVDGAVQRMKSGADEWEASKPTRPSALSEAALAHATLGLIAQRRGDTDGAAARLSAARRSLDMRTSLAAPPDQTSQEAAKAVEDLAGKLGTVPSG